MTAPIGISGGVGRRVVIPSVSYPSVLLAELQAAYPAQASDISMTNQGKGAENIVDGVLRFEDALASTGANVVLIQEGINSIGYPGVDVATELTRDMVWQARQRGVAVFVGSMLPTVTGRQRSQDATALEAYNALLKAMCVQEKVTFVDLYAGLLPQAETLIGIDGLHPTEAGYRKIADLFFTAIRAELEEK